MNKHGGKRVRPVVFWGFGLGLGLALGVAACSSFGTFHKNVEEPAFEELLVYSLLPSITVELYHCCLIKHGFKSEQFEDGTIRSDFSASYRSLDGVPRLTHFQVDWKTGKSEEGDPCEGAVKNLFDRWSETKKGQMKEGELFPRSADHRLFAEGGLYPKRGILIHDLGKEFKAKVKWDESKKIDCRTEIQAF